jgi:NifU-like protein involved in Fe-S cluster formation
MKVDEALKIKNSDIAGYLKLPPVKLHCSMLAEEAIKKAIEDVKVKSELSEASSKTNV